MEVVKEGVLQGSIPGTLVGRRAELTTGVVGNGLKCDGWDPKCVDYGYHFDECYHNPDLCTEGVTMAFWIQKDAYVGEVFTTGRRRDNVGHHISVEYFGQLFFATFHNTSYDYYIEPYGWGGRAQWKHLAFTWYYGEGIVVYFNGCDADPDKSRGFANTKPRKITNSAIQPILVSQGGYGNGDLVLDEFIIWHEKLSPEQIWQLYIQGGTLKTK